MNIRLDNAPTTDPAILHELSDMFAQSFPEMDAREQSLALSLYRLLSQGTPVSMQTLSDASCEPIDDVKNALDNWPGVFYDDQARVIGFWGISVQEMTHRLNLDGRTVYAWCAWDTLFIPELVNETAQVTSTCPVTNETIEFIVSPERVIANNNPDVVVSFLLPDQSALKENIVASFCHFVYFFHDRAAGEQWVSEHQGTFLLTIDDAFTVGKMVNAARYQKINIQQGK